MSMNATGPRRGRSAGRELTPILHAKYTPAPPHVQEAAAKALCVCAVDPGLNGSVAFYFPDAPGRIIAEDLPVAAGGIDGATLAESIRQKRPDFAIVERVGAMPKQGVASTFRFGMASLAWPPAAFLRGLSRLPRGSGTSALAKTKSSRGR